MSTRDAIQGVQGTGSWEWKEKGELYKDNSRVFDGLNWDLQHVRSLNG